MVVVTKFSLGREREREIRPSRSPLPHMSQVTLVGAPVLYVPMPETRNIHAAFGRSALPCNHACATRYPGPTEGDRPSRTKYFLASAWRGPRVGQAAPVLRLPCRALSTRGPHRPGRLLPQPPSEVLRRGRSPTESVTHATHVTQCVTP